MSSLSEFDAIVVEAELKSLKFIRERYDALLDVLSPDGFCAIAIYTQEPPQDEWERTGNELFGRPILIQRTDT